MEPLKRLLHQGLPPTTVLQPPMVTMIHLHQPHPVLKVQLLVGTDPLVMANQQEALVITANQQEALVMANQQVLVLVRPVEALVDSLPGQAVEEMQVTEQVLPLEVQADTKAQVVQELVPHPSKSFVVMTGTVFQLKRLEGQVIRLETISRASLPTDGRAGILEQRLLREAAMAPVVEVMGTAGDKLGIIFI